MKKFISAMKVRTYIIFFTAIILVVIASGNIHSKIISYNTNRIKSLSAAHIVSKYNAAFAKKTPVYATSLIEVSQLANDNDVIFTGTMTGYGPDCVGCGNSVACSPYPVVTNGNITYNDNSYGEVRILAADKTIPCGTIIKFSNVTFSVEPIYGIVLDRGGAINGTLMDLLYASEAEAGIVGRQRNVQYEVQRWGW